MIVRARFCGVLSLAFLVGITLTEGAPVMDEKPNLPMYRCPRIERELRLKDAKLRLTLENEDGKWLVTRAERESDAK